MKDIEALGLSPPSFATGNIPLASPFVARGAVSSEDGVAFAANVDSSPCYFSSES
jgi:hypothetical protein